MNITEAIGSIPMASPSWPPASPTSHHSALFVASCSWAVVEDLAVDAVGLNLLYHLSVQDSVPWRRCCPSPVWPFPRTLWSSLFTIYCTGNHAVICLWECWRSGGSTARFGWRTPSHSRGWMWGRHVSKSKGHPWSLSWTPESCLPSSSPLAWPPPQWSCWRGVWALVPLTPHSPWGTLVWSCLGQEPSHIATFFHLTFTEHHVAYACEGGQGHCFRDWPCHLLC